MAGRNSTGRRLRGSRLIGLDELDRQIAQIAKLYGPKTGQKIMTSALRAAAKPIIADAKAGIPESEEWHHLSYSGKQQPERVGPGFARRSIKAKVLREPVGGNRWRAYIGVGRLAFYAVQWVELGTSKQARQPWLVPALQKEKGAAVRAMQRRMATAIRSVIKKGGKK